MENTISINGINYVREDATTATEVDGLRYAIVRSADQGVVCGFVEQIDGRRVTLRNARQMWQWSSKFVLQDIAEHGVTSSYENLFSCEMSQPLEMLEACGVLYCTDKGRESLRSVEAQDKSNG